MTNNMTNKKIVPVSLYAGGNRLIIDLFSLCPGMKVLVTKSDGSAQTLNMEDVNMSYTDNPLTGNVEVGLRLTLKKPIDEEPET